jgi:lipopolysaccharide transport system permease protein
MLALRDIKLRYKQTFLGVLWVVLQPALTAAIFALVFGHFARLPSNGQPYLLFVFSGLMGWNLVSGVLQRAGNSLLMEARLIAKVYFPRLLIPCASAAAALVDFAVWIIMMAILAFWFGVSFGPTLLLFPFIAFMALALAVGVSLWVSALTVKYRDFAYVLPFFIQVWLYASPVVYGTELIPPSWRVWFELNPMTGIVEGFRGAFFGGSEALLRPLIIAACTTGIILATSVLFFRRMERDIADAL